jgi:hypothetical protein
MKNKLDVFAEQITKINENYISQLIELADEWGIRRDEVICKAAACVINVADLVNETR